MKRIFLLSALVLGALLTSASFLPTSSKPDDRLVTGHVFDETSHPLPGANVLVKGTSIGAVTDLQGYFALQVPDGYNKLVISYIGYQSKEIRIVDDEDIRCVLKVDRSLEKVNVTRHTSGRLQPQAYNQTRIGAARDQIAAYHAAPYIQEHEDYHPDWNTEDYDVINENRFYRPSDQPLSTFSIDVDAASYSNMRRFINGGQMPPKDAVRIEEMVNYFSYDYPQPTGDAPFSINMEVGACPWNAEHKLIHIGLQGKEIPVENLPASNLVFLLDVSGSMNAPNKLPLVQKSFKMLAGKLREQDRIAIVVYAGAAGLVLPSTSGVDKEAIVAAIDRLSAGGSTAGAAGIKLAYRIARDNFVEGGNNRVILATDGDFNIGTSSDGELTRLIEEQREHGVFLTVLGFGMGNYKDNKMQKLADNGNGNHAYIDDITEAQKVFIHEFGGTLFTIAKDVKIQVEFNPAHVAGYRLIGYENRMLAAEDFNDDKKDAGEIGSGHTVTALYEIIPAGVQSPFLADVDPLRYQEQESTRSGSKSSEMLHVKFRYKAPDGQVSKLLEHSVSNREAVTTDNFTWSAAVAAFGMLLRESEYKGQATYDAVLEWAQSAKGEDSFGYRKEFIRLVREVRGMQGTGDLEASK